MQKHTSSKKHRWRWRRNGAILPLMALIISVLLIFIAIAVNTNWMLLTRSESQAAADLASLSALSFYSENLDSPDRVVDSRDLGAEILRLNGQGEQLASRVSFGFLENPADHNPNFLKNENKITAVRIEPDLNRRIPLFMGGLLGKDEVSITAQSVSAFQPIDVVLAIDASRSMNGADQQNRESGEYPPGGTTNHEPPLPGSKWFAMTDAVEEFLNLVEESNPNARIGLVTFGGGLTSKVPSPLDDLAVRSELPIQSIELRNQITDKLRSYQSFPALGLGTFIFDAIHESLDMIETGNPKGDRFIILLTDGQQFTGGEGRKIFRPPPSVAAERARDKNIKIHTINFRLVANSELLDVADVSGGDSFDAADGDELRVAFRELIKKFKLRLAD